MKLQSMLFQENEDAGELVIDKCLSRIRSGVLPLICDLHTEGFDLITNQGDPSTALSFSHLPLATLLLTVFC